jgi:hypothetical protein
VHSVGVGEGFIVEQGSSFRSFRRWSVDTLIMVNIVYNFEHTRYLSLGFSQRQYITASFEISWSRSSCLGLRVPPPTGRAIVTLLSLNVGLPGMQGNTCSSIEPPKKGSVHEHPFETNPTNLGTAREV